MIFSISASDTPADLLKVLAKTYARKNIVLFKFGPNEIALNNYFISNYHTGLVQVCLKLLKAAKFNSNGNHEIIITFIDKKDDNIASLITYGNGKLQGSNILKNAFYRN